MMRRLPGQTETLDDFSGMLNKNIILPLLKALGISIIIFALGGV